MDYSRYTPAMRSCAYSLNKLHFMPTCLNHVTVLSGDKVVKTIHNKDEACCSSLRSRTPDATHLVVRLMPDYKGWDRVINQEYLDWVVSESCLSSYFLENSVHDVLKNKSVVIRCNVPSDLMMNAVQMFRYVWEFPNMTDHWSELVKVGVDPHYAFVVVHNLAGSVHSVRLSPHGSGNSNHFVFPFMPTKEVLNRFKNLVPFTNDKLFSDCGRYTAIQAAWCEKAKEKSLYEMLEGMCTSKPRKVSHAFGTTEVVSSDNLYVQIKNAIDKILGE